MFASRSRLRAGFTCLLMLLSVTIVTASPCFAGWNLDTQEPIDFDYEPAAIINPGSGSNSYGTWDGSAGHGATAEGAKSVYALTDLNITSAIPGENEVAAGFPTVVKQRYVWLPEGDPPIQPYSNFHVAVTGAATVTKTSTAAANHGSGSATTSGFEFDATIVGGGTSSLNAEAPQFYQYNPQSPDFYHWAVGNITASAEARGSTVGTVHVYSSANIRFGAVIRQGN